MQVIFSEYQILQANTANVGAGCIINFPKFSSLHKFEEVLGGNCFLAMRSERFQKGGKLKNCPQKIQ